MKPWNDLKKNQLFFCRVFFYLTLPPLLLLLYWSSLVKEEQLIETNLKIREIESRLHTITNTWQFTALHQMPPEELFLPTSDTMQERAAIKLFSPDPFYRTTLPRLLGYDFKIAGCRRQTLRARPENLHPMSNNAEIGALWDLSIRSMGRTHIGFYDRLAPSLAVEIEIRPRKDFPGEDVEKTGEFWVFLRKDLYWDSLNPALLPPHIKLDDFFLEKQKVTAWDVKFYYDAVMNPYLQIPGAIAERELFQEIESFQVIDESTFVVRWKIDKESPQRAMPYQAHLLVAGLRPLPRFLYQRYPDGTKIIEEDSAADIYQNHSVWAQIFVDHWAQHLMIGCGDWQMTHKTDRELLFRRNAFAPDPYGALNENIAFYFCDSLESSWQDFKENRIDFCSLHGNYLFEKERFMNSDLYKEQLKEGGNAIHHIRYAERSFTYIAWNLHDPRFSEKRVRQALTQAIDREALIRQVLSGQGFLTTGPFHLQSPSYNADIKPYAFDPIQASLLLEKAGWIDRDGDGIREQTIEGKKVLLSFRLTYFLKNTISKIACEAIRHQLRRIGVECQLHGLDVTDLSKVMDERDFDALFLAWQLGTPPETTRQLWHSSSSKSQGSSNFISYENPQVDDLIEQLEYCYKREERNELYHRLHAILHEEQPYTFLYSPVTLVVFRERLKNMFPPVERQDLLPGAQTIEPQPRLFYVDPQYSGKKPRV